MLLARAEPPLLAAYEDRLRLVAELDWMVPKLGEMTRSMLMFARIVP